MQSVWTSRRCTSSVKSLIRNNFSHTKLESNVWYCNDNTLIDHPSFCRQSSLNRHVNKMPWYGCVKQLILNLQPLYSRDPTMFFRHLQYIPKLYFVDTSMSNINHTHRSFRSFSNRWELSSTGWSLISTCYELQKPWQPEMRTLYLPDTSWSLIISKR